MKNKEPISGSIQEDVSVRSGRHGYEPLRDVVEITFHGYGCNYIQVIDLKAARELDLQLRKILPPLYEEL
jgi:hypothetical protein